MFYKGCMILVSIEDAEFRYIDVLVSATVGYGLDRIVQIANCKWQMANFGTALALY